MNKQTNPWQRKQVVHAQRLRFAVQLLLFAAWCSSCVVKQKDEPEVADVSVRWELITNFTGSPGVFEARFTLINDEDFAFTDQNWALFFNIAPRPIVQNKTPQASRVEHINGDWYKLIPNENFLLEPGDSVGISYFGNEGVIKESDRPMGLYFVFYDDEENEERIAEVSDFHFLPFAKSEQILRGPEDEEPIPTPEWIHKQNSDLSLLQASELKTIIPSPVKVQQGVGNFEVNERVSIVYEPGLENEARHLAEGLQAVTGRQVPVSDSRPSGGTSIELSTEKLIIAGKDREAYVLDISARGISITGSDPAGVFYGIQSLRALIPLGLYRKSENSFMLPEVRIEDAPRFGFRGIHLDVARNFQSKETILRVLDLLSFYKVNRFLFYTTEDEGWRLEIEDLPELTTVGAERRHTSGKETPVLHPAYGSGPYAHGKNNYGTGYYTRDDFVEILKYAKERHIKVIPELNFPGHARAAIKAMEARYVRLMKEGKEEEANEYRLIDPEDNSKYLSAQSFKDNVVSVARESTYRFYEKVVDEVAEMYEEAGLVLDEFHAGGDEVPEGAWTDSPMAAALMSDHPEISDPKNLQAYFFKELLKRLKKRNLRVDGWEEVALLKNESGGYDPNPEFAGQNVVPFIWNNLFDFQDLGYRLANAGYPVVLCNVSNFYFDLAYSNDPREPGLYWAGFVDTRDAWLFAPFDMFKTTLHNSMGRRFDPEKDFAGKERLLPEARKNILGIEAQLWSETIKGRDMLEYYLLPKLFGFAESAWASGRVWETIEDGAKREEAIQKEWNVFANTLGQREMPRLGYLNGGYNYRIPPPGAVVRAGKLYASTSFPGLTIRYSTDGTEPDENDPVYSGAVEVTGRVVVKAYDLAGNSSRAMYLDCTFDTGAIYPCPD